MTIEEKEVLHKEIKKNRRSNWLLQGVTVAVVSAALFHFWDAGTAYLKDRPIKEAREKLVIAKVDTLIAFQKSHAREDLMRDSLQDIKWIADAGDKVEINKKIDGMQDVQISMLGTIASIQNRGKNYLLDCDE